MPIATKYLKILRNMATQYCTAEYGKDGRIDKTVQGVKTCKKARQVFYAKMRKEGIDYRKMGLSDEELGRMFGSPTFDDHMLDTFAKWEREGFTIKSLKKMQTGRNYKDVVTEQNDYFEMFVLYSASKGIKLPHIKLNKNWYMDEAAEMIVASHLGFYPELEKNSPYEIELAIESTEVAPLEPKRFPSSDIKNGIYLIQPHAKMITHLQKKAIVKSIKFTKYLGEDLYLITGRTAIGIIRLHEPRKITLNEFKELQEYHQISEDERKKWCKEYKAWCTGPLYYYKIDLKTVFTKPKPVKVSKGIQTFIEDVKFLSMKDLTLKDLEY